MQRGSLPKYVLYVNEATQNVDAMVQSSSIASHVLLQKLSDLVREKINLPWFLDPKDSEGWPVLVDTQELWGRKGDAALQFIFERTQRPAQ